MSAKARDDQVISEHRLQPGRVLMYTWPYVLVGGIFLLIGVGLVFVSLSRKTVDKGGALAGAVSAVVGAGLCGVYGYRLFTDVALVRLYQGGLDWQEGSRARRISWEEIKEVQRKELHRLTHGAAPSDWNRHSRLRLVLRDGSEVSFNHGLTGYDELATVVQEQTTRALLPRYREQLTAAGRVAFGPLLLTPTALAGSDFVDHFEDITHFQVNRGWITWQTRHGQPREHALHDVPNYLVLLALVAEMSGLGSPDRPPDE